MDLGKTVKIVEVPLTIPVRRTVEQPAPREDEKPIPLPADWPIRRPARVPDHAHTSTKD